MSNTKKPTLDPSSENFGLVMNCAVRYVIGRETYAPGSVISFLRPLLPWLDDRTLWCFDQDISEARDGVTGQSLGDPKIDAPIWLRFLEEVQAELRRRETERREQDSSVVNRRGRQED